MCVEDDAVVVVVGMLFFQSKFSELFTFVKCFTCVKWHRWQLVIAFTVLISRFYAHMKNVHK